MHIQLRPGHRLEWAILAPLDASRLESLVRTCPGFEPWGEYDDLDRTWFVVAGSGDCAALVETQPGSSGMEGDVAVELARRLGTVVYAVGFAGYDDPDLGLPFIEAYEGDSRKLLWMGDAMCDDASMSGWEQRELSPGPDGVPCDDPFDFVAALGCPLGDLY